MSPFLSSFHLRNIKLFLCQDVLIFQLKEIKEEHTNAVQVALQYPTQEIEDELEKAKQDFAGKTNVLTLVSIHLPPLMNTKGHNNQPSFWVCFFNSNTYILIVHEPRQINPDLILVAKADTDTLGGDPSHTGAELVQSIQAETWETFGAEALLLDDQAYNVIIGICIYYHCYLFIIYNSLFECFLHYILSLILSFFQSIWMMNLGTALRL